MAKTQILKLYVYESINLDRLITYPPYSNKFENPLLNGQGIIFYGNLLLLVVSLNKWELNIVIAHKGDMYW